MSSFLVISGMLHIEAVLLGGILLILPGESLLLGAFVGESSSQHLLLMEFHDVILISRIVTSSLLSVETVDGSTSKD